MTTQAANTASDSRQEQAQALVRRRAYWAAGMGLIPVPVIDVLGITGVQVKMLKEISDLYGVNFFEDKAKTVVGALISGLGAWVVTGAVANSLFKVIPVVGQAVGLLGGSAVGAALTLAVGNVFIQHYETGGTLLDFDAAKMREHFRKEFKKSKSAVKDMKQDAKPAAETEASPEP